MPRTALLLLAGLVLTHAASAAYTEFFFATEQSDWKCPGLAFDCPPPEVCTYDNLVDKYYCCGAGGDAVCWTGSSDCTPNALQCGQDEYAFCCLDGRETCTQRTGQINICWATADNPFRPFSADFVNKTFSSLSADSPAATSLPIEPDDLAESTTTAPSSPTTPFSSPTDANDDDENKDFDSNSDSSTLSGGAIAGIVVGGVAGIALIALGVFFLLRRGRRSATQDAGATGSTHDSKQAYAYAPAPVSPHGPGSGYAQSPAGVHEVFVLPAEMDGRGGAVSEMEGSSPAQVQGGR